jgi:1-deoxy-D-xylulose-5-phosphate reductoisomerase
MKKRVAVLGATGSIGKSTLEILRNKKDQFEPVLFTAYKNYSALKALKDEFPQARIAMEEEILNAIAEVKADITVNGISGAAGLKPSTAVINSGSDLALANKETLVMAGALIFSMAKEKNVNIIPVDSEHSAIFKLIEAHGRHNVSEIILTASGGPFRNYSPDELSKVTAKDALAHPTWSMGPKITIDSSTLANKGLEVIEAACLFGLPPEKILVTIHPQSVVHSMVRLKNGAVFAQMSKPDMKLPIYDALCWPLEADYAYGELDFNSLSLTFEKCDYEKFPMLSLAFKALKNAPFLPIVYNAANETAVAAFFEGRIGFLDIPRIVGYVLDRSAIETKKVDSIKTILDLDGEVRKTAEEFIGSNNAYL